MRHPVTLEWAEGVYEALASKDRQLARRLQRKVARWAETGAGDWRALRGEEGGSRLRDGKWRVLLFQAPSGIVYVVDVENRDRAYR
ncbi:hypothetical protein HN371_00580 [Candidatus Poribacteria bacterium]|jgi:mRNA-degrading endonuclease RelE of RelBE toxin-antitoxin system|nr:hypothetical protein [Candidatus Poribacteria bacterium]MBT5532525.1 hypothetical protein [Candidatus Poribacteria bacterium]MBT5714492.1 hypothetical protein [Candidatus Poribacteria bacterium]MBT7096325.1 hypothetical protein [Candidatus Poribacteria bacterium]MBT7808646.1 hypothetical protein [Candidatus Poribacteria bacterium]